jgi:hypothetical protein
VVVSTEKVSNQLKFVKNNHSVSQHLFATKLASGVKSAIEQEVPDLQLRVGSKAVSGGKITLQITGSIKTEDTDDMKRVDDAVRQAINTLKNPSNLLSTIE